MYCALKRAIVGYRVEELIPMGWWKRANEKVETIVAEEVTKRRDAGEAGRN